MRGGWYYPESAWKKMGENGFLYPWFEEELGIEPATPDETRRILGLKSITNVNY